MTETKTDTQQQQMLRGTAWMTASNIISRLLGALYIIPWYAWMGKQGDQANALFGQGYNIYVLTLQRSWVAARLLPGRTTRAWRLSMLTAA